MGYLAGYSGLGGDELEGEATLGGLIGEVELQRAMMEVTHPELELGSIEELRVTSLERADTALQRVNGAPSDTGADLSGADFGRAWDAVGHLVAVEDADGELRFLLGGPWFEDPEPLIAAGCDRIEVEAVAGRSLPELFGLDWMAEATGPRPGPLPILDIIGIGERAMDPSLTADDPVRTCPLAHWTERVEIVGLGFHPFGISMVCAGDAGIPVHLTPHGLRHSAITIGLDAGVSLRDMQDFARHADPKTTRRYDRSRHALNHHATSAIAHYLAGGN